MVRGEGGDRLGPFNGLGVVSFLGIAFSLLPAVFCRCTLVFVGVEGLFTGLAGGTIAAKFF